VLFTPVASLLLSIVIGIIYILESLEQLSASKLEKMTPLPKSENSDVENSALGRPRNHIEGHTDYGDIIRDVIIGFADGLTVPFALTAGLSS
jgi:hypothetical protein